MTYRPERMKFGIFLAPFHRVGENLTLALQRNLRLIDHLDELGYDEAWIGEHHSAARETIADPVAFIAAAAERTRRIRLGTGVLSLPYHHPLMVADRMQMLDHLTHGRAMLGVGPGALTSDAYMMGIEPTEQRRMMYESIEAILALLRGVEPVTMETDWFTLRDARLQMPNFTKPHLEVAVTTTFTPSGATASGRFGTGLLSVAGASHDGFTRTWGWVEDAAAEHGNEADRGGWRVVLPIHIAPTREQAIAEIEDGYSRRAYIGDLAEEHKSKAFGEAFGATGLDARAAIDDGGLAVGTPDDVIEQIEGVLERSGGLGGILCLAHEWADTQATFRSYELLARYVMPHFQSQMPRVLQSRDWFEASFEHAFGGGGAATRRAFEDAGQELPEELRPHAERFESSGASADGGPA